jgi:hypothetical protein
MHPQDMLTFNDLQLLAIEMDLLWGAQARPELVLACAREGVRVRLGKHVPPELARALVAEIDGVQPVVDSNTPPPQLERWRILLEDALGAAVRLTPGSGPSYVIHPDVSFRTSAELVRSDANDLAALRGANPGNWGADEWHRLLEGHLGPWVMARHGERILSICHTPASNARAAEAGVWTDPEFRGHGHAAATTDSRCVNSSRSARVQNVPSTITSSAPSTRNWSATAAAAGGAAAVQTTIDETILASVSRRGRSLGHSCGPP